MHYTTLGHTNLHVSVAGLGTGGFSRLGLKTGKTEDEAARLILDAVGLGINFIGTAPVYGTEGVVGRALKSIPRQSVVIATKSAVNRNGEWWSPERVVASLDNSLRAMGTDYVDVFNLHGVEADEYDYALPTIVPALLAQKAKGKIRHIGVTENPINDFTNAMLARAVRDAVWEVFMVGFHMMHQGARKNVFLITREKGIGTLLMFAVRSIFADPPRVAREMRELAAKGLVEKWLARPTTRSAFSFTRAAPPISPRRPIGLSVTSRASMSCCSAPATRRICGRTWRRCSRRRCRKLIGRSLRRCLAI
jgi:aryl-alcohol dehydrogenase-like predicted oxidoreductase